VKTLKEKSTTSKIGNTVTMEMAHIVRYLTLLFEIEREDY